MRQDRKRRSLFDDSLDEIETTEQVFFFYEALHIGWLPSL